MDLHLDAMNERRAWSAAFSRLDAWLAAHRLDDSVCRARLALRILDRAKAEHAREPEREPLRVTMEVADRLLEEWCARVFEGRNVPPSRRVSAGRVALLLTGAIRENPELFLAAELPEAFRSKLTGTWIRTGPDLEVSSMTPREIDYGVLHTVARETWQRAEWKPLLRAFAFWTGVYLASVLLYFRFR